MADIIFDRQHQYIPRLQHRFKHVLPLILHAVGLVKVPIHPHPYILFVDSNSIEIAYIPLGDSEEHVCEMPLPERAQNYKHLEVMLAQFALQATQELKVCRQCCSIGVAPTTAIRRLPQSTPGRIRLLSFGDAATVLPVPNAMEPNSAALPTSPSSSRTPQPTVLFPLHPRVPRDRSMFRCVCVYRTGLLLLDNLQVLHIVFIGGTISSSRTLTKRRCLNVREMIVSQPPKFHFQISPNPREPIQLVFFVLVHFSAIVLDDSVELVA
jgi:hypothetical protein